MKPLAVTLFRLKGGLVLAALLLSLLAPALPAWAQDESPSPPEEPSPTLEFTATPQFTPTPAPTAGATPMPAEGAALFSAIDVEAFPQIDAYLLVNNAGGQRVGALDGGAFNLYENGLPVPNVSATEQAVGVQVVFALDPTDAFGARDANGVTRLDYIKQALTTYAQTQMRAGIDDVTILAPESTIVAHSLAPEAVAMAVNAYNSAYGGAADPFPLLHQAVAIASDVPVRAGMRRFVVYLSNGLHQADAAGRLAAVVEGATRLQVPIYTVFVGPAGGENIPGSVNLLRLAQSTGGARFSLGKADSLQPIFDLLIEQGQQYQLRYRSTLAMTGQHTLQARVTLPDGAVVSSAESTFPLRVEAPTLAISNLPADVVRVAPYAGASVEAAQPAELAVTLRVDFADGHLRDLRQAQLLVDGEVVRSLPAGPAPESGEVIFRWSLAGYAERATHTLQARVIDELGLAAESEPETVSVSLQVPVAPAAQSGPALPAAARRNWPLVAAGLIGLALTVTVGGVVWLIGSRRQAAVASAPGPAPVRAPVVVEAPPAEKPAAKASPRGGLAARLAPHIRSPQAGAASLAPAPPAPPGELDETQPGVPSRSPRRSPQALPGAGPLGLSGPISRHLHWPGRPGKAAAQPPEQALPFLEVVQPGRGAAPPGRIVLNAPDLSLGRDPVSADVVFEDRSVSRLHAHVAVDGGTVSIYDEESTSGTWVNYAPVPAEGGCELHDGDLINLGRVQLRFRRPDATGPLGGRRPRVLKADDSNPAH